MYPDPTSNIFAGRIFQPRNFIEVVVIELFQDRFEGAFDLSKIQHPAAVLINRTRQVEADMKTVAMQARAFVAGWHIGQAMRRFEVKFLEYFHRAHRG